jgi:NAD(P)-dependent dehydrogenase (short-subunit alcohol dehydrogenase family)
VEWAQYGIRINSLSPGYIGTVMSKRAPKKMTDVWMPLIPFHRMGEPEELIGAVIYLAADSSGYTSGSDLIVDGAYTCM